MVWPVIFVKGFGISVRLGLRRFGYRREVYRIGNAVSYDASV